MVSLSRWKTAQQYERGFWEQLANQIAQGATSQLMWYDWRAKQLIDRLRALGLESLTHGQARVVEVGSGPVGLVAYYPAQERVAVDPLAEYYGGNQALSELRDPGVVYRAGPGEQLPCESGRYDLAVIENCIDHVQDMSAVMAELRRVLRDDGILYLTVNSRTRPGFLMHRLISSLRLDPGHPHTFTRARVERFIRQHGFELLHIDSESYRDALWNDLKTPELTSRLKAVLGVSEFLVRVVARRLPRAAGALGEASGAEAQVQ